MPRHLTLTVVLANCLLLSMASAAQSVISSNKIKFDDLLARAEQGDAKAQVVLGDAYLGRAFQTGVTVKPDPSEALRWFLRAADQNNVDALLELGTGYESGFFGPKNAGKATEYYRRAAELGDTSAAADLVHLYLEGADGLPRNFDEAAHWAGCPMPSITMMQSCQATTSEQLPKSALAFLRNLKCDAGSNYDYGAQVHLSADSDAPYYEVCCHDSPHGPCAAVLIGEVAGKWVNLTAQIALLGFETTCDGLMVLDTAHAGIHDLCLPDQCKEPESNRCRPTILQFNGTRYFSIPASSVRSPEHP